MKSLTSYKDAVENERRRRVAWEKAQEAKCLERHKELQCRLDIMQEEINSLKSTVDVLQASTTAAMESSSHQVNAPYNDASGPISYPYDIREALDQSEQVASGQSSTRKRPRSVSPSEDGESSKQRNHSESRLQTIHVCVNT